MDGVAVYLSSVAPAAAEHELHALQIGSAPESFVYFMYSQDDWTRELEPGELEAIVRRLGQQPSVAAAIADADPSFFRVCDKAVCQVGRTATLKREWSLAKHFPPRYA